MKSKNKEIILQATKNIIANQGVECVTVRNVCKESGLSNGTFYYYFKNMDELLLSFIMVKSFEDIEISSDNVANKIIELYMILIDNYLSYGKDFMKSFYTPSNTALQSYMSEENGKFGEKTVMARVENEIISAQNNNELTKDIDAHTLSSDICSIVKGLIFEYCMIDSDFDLKSNVKRVISNYLKSYQVLNCNNKLNTFLS